MGFKSLFNQAEQSEITNEIKDNWTQALKWTSEISSGIVLLSICSAVPVPYSPVDVTLFNEPIPRECSVFAGKVASV